KSVLFIRSFNDFINMRGLVDLGYECDKFIRSNRQFGVNFIKERLDRVLVSMQWRAEFLNGYVKYLDDMGSDYKLLFIDSD
ncbi:hypothetical protein C1T30_43650, partial [Bacillus sp. MBGLi97]